ncbi:hypothetical protein TrVGV298_009432 [Trichoderma virens]|nr:hypothetical protein TrVGV298_009432 [Trichoderma virens]
MHSASTFRFLKVYTNDVNGGCDSGRREEMDARNTRETPPFLAATTAYTEVYAVYTAKLKMERANLFGMWERVLVLALRQHWSITAD